MTCSEECYRDISSDTCCKRHRLGYHKTTMAHKHTILVFISIAFCLVHLPSSYGFETNDIESFFKLLDTPLSAEKNESNSVGESGSEQAIPDLEASVGRLFKYMLPTHVFPENCTNFQVWTVIIGETIYE